MLLRLVIDAYVRIPCISADLGRAPQARPDSRINSRKRPQQTQQQQQMQQQQQQQQMQYDKVTAAPSYTAGD
jgi:hypothetical protein